MKLKYEIMTVQQENEKVRVIHKFFDDYDTAREHADRICENTKTTKCSMYFNDILIMDIL